jgi:hypothetical protein
MSDIGVSIPDSRAQSDESVGFAMGDIGVSIRTSAGEEYIPVEGLWSRVAEVEGLAEIEVTLISDGVNLPFERLCSAPQNSVLCRIRRWADVARMYPRGDNGMCVTRTAQRFGYNGCFLSEELEVGSRFNLNLRLQGGPKDLVDCWILRCILRDLKQVGIEVEGWRLTTTI